MRAGPDVLGPRILNLDDSMITQILKSSADVIALRIPIRSIRRMEHVRTPMVSCVYAFHDRKCGSSVKILDLPMRTNPASLH